MSLIRASKGIFRMSQAMESAAPSGEKAAVPAAETSAVECARGFKE